MYVCQRKRDNAIDWFETGLNMKVSCFNYPDGDISLVEPFCDVSAFERVVLSVQYLNPNQG
jgi:hypothetical protein